MGWTNDHPDFQNTSKKYFTSIPSDQAARIIRGTENPRSLGIGAILPYFVYFQNLEFFCFINTPCISLASACGLMDKIWGYEWGHAFESHAPPFLFSKKTFLQSLDRFKVLIRVIILMPRLVDQYLARYTQLIKHYLMIVRLLSGNNMALKIGRKNETRREIRNFPIKF